MGTLMKVSLAIIRPTEHCIREQSLKRVLEMRLNGVPTVPPFLEKFNGSYLVIDGHNRLLIDDLFGEEYPICYIANNPEDILHSNNGFSPAALHSSNTILARRFAIAPSRADFLRDTYRIRNIHELLLEYQDGGCTTTPFFQCEDFSFLSSPSEALNHFHLQALRKV